MKITEAAYLRRGDVVWLDYTPTPGHGLPYHGPAAVRCDVKIGHSDVARGFVWVVLKPASWLNEAVYASKFIGSVIEKKGEGLG